MRFTEHELTTALTCTAKQLLAVQRKDVRKGWADIDAVWDEMARYERFKILDALGSQLLPVLVALPDVEVAPGTRPTFTDQQIMAAVEQCLGEGGGRLRRKAAVTARLAVVRMALQQVPPRGGPDSGVAPDLG
jgi:hypothetical protein